MSTLSYLDDSRLLTVLGFFVSPASILAVEFITQSTVEQIQQAVGRINANNVGDISVVWTPNAPGETTRLMLTGRSPHRTIEGSMFLRARWVEWMTYTVSSIGFKNNDLLRLRELDHEYKNVIEALSWARTQKLHEHVFSLCRGIGYYSYVRGIWRDPINLIAADSCRELALMDPSNPIHVINEALYLSYHVQMLCRQRCIDEISTHKQRLLMLRSAVDDCDVRFEIEHAYGLMYLYSGRSARALSIYRRMKSWTVGVSSSNYVVWMQWHATAMLRNRDLEQAEVKLIEARELAVRRGMDRSVSFIDIKLAAINLARGNFESARRILEAANDNAHQQLDQKRQGEIHTALAAMYRAMSDLPSAEAALTAALQSFRKSERLEDANYVLKLISTIGEPTTKDDFVSL